MLLNLFFGFVFGYLLLQARLHRFNTIGGMATLEDLTVAKAILLALGIGTLLISLLIALGVASFSIRPLVMGPLALGGLIFGVGMAILGYCPGTMVISAGEGSLDAVTGIFGGIAGGVVYYYAEPLLTPLMGSSFGNISLFSMVGSFNLVYWLLAVLLSGVLIATAFLLHRLEKGNNRQWMYAGIGLALLNGVMFMKLTGGTHISASSFFPWAGGHIFGLTGTEWFGRINASGTRLFYFLVGAFFAGLLFAMLRREFAFKVIHERWARYHGNSVAKRLVVAFVGGFLLLFGARMAGGCTSGLVISGGMQIAISSYLFAMFTFIGLLGTGHLFYKK